MSLYNIETEDQCWAKVDDLLELTRHAKATPSVKTIGALKNRLKEYFDLGNTIKGKNRMSKVEQIFFWPSIYEAYVYAPKLNTPRTWSERLSEVEYKLEKLRR